MTSVSITIDDGVDICSKVDINIDDLFFSMELVSCGVRGNISIARWKSEPSIPLLVLFLQVVQPPH